MGLFGKKEPERVQVLEQEMRCQICGGKEFWQRRAQLNTSFASFLNLDWTNPSSTCIICAQCGYIHWFAPLQVPKNAR